MGFLIAVMLAAVPGVVRAQGMDTFAQGLEMDAQDCKARVAAVLTEHGYASRQDFGYGWLAWTRESSVSVACVQTPPATHTVLVVTATGTGPSAARAALVASIVNPRMVTPPPPPPGASACAYLTGAPAAPGDQRGVLVNYAQLPAAVDWIAVADPGGGHFPSMWFRPQRRPNGQWFLAGPLQAGRTYVLRAFDRSDQPLGECAFTVR